MDFRLANSSEKVFTNILMWQYIVSIVSICNGTFQLTHTDSSVRLSMICNSLFVFNVLFEIAVFCWFAGLFTAKSVEVSTAYYMYDWLNSSQKVKKCLLILMHHSQQPIYMTAGTVIRLSMASFLQVVKAAYSYFTLMQSLYNKSI
ncbi:hypothetical protein GWI33_009876 [Rhynchophorus ferrugineus]|uniref:Odorant receptor n=2 Tax=Rhynchophorus ferrugineus TaxID=354439 RepID=A0A834MFR8_RHYFE|nr:hypothetical protein GWI33_009876 [Rhynchophorus ferrugineus]